MGLRWDHTSAPHPPGLCPVALVPRAPLKSSWLLGPGLAEGCEGRCGVPGLPL